MVGPLVFVAWCVALSIVVRIGYGRVRRLAGRTATDIDDIILKALRAPLAVVILVTGGMILGKILPLSAEWERILSLGVKITVIFAGVLFFDALIKAFILQDIGMSPALREKYKGEINLADQAQAGAVFLKKENIPEKYGMGSKAENHLLFLITHHDRLHHIVRGEYTLHAIREVIDKGDTDLFNAFFLCSVIMISALGEEQILEDLASRGRKR